jgi:CRP-like cAMP-binding protein
MNGLLDLFEKIHPLPDEFREDLQSNTVEKEHPRKTLLLKQGKTCKDIHFIVKGLARAFYFKNDTDVTSWVMRENDLILSVNSFFRQQPSQENIELLEDSILISLSRDHLLNLYRNYPQFNYVTRVIMEHYYILSEERTYAMRMKTARERYEQLLEHDPQLFQRVPLKHIASYLGMKAETLSRIRAKIR